MGAFVVGVCCHQPLKNLFLLRWVGVGAGFSCLNKHSFAVGHFVAQRHRLLKMFEEFLGSWGDARTVEFSEGEIRVERNCFVEVLNRVGDAQLLLQITSGKILFPGFF